MIYFFLQRRKSLSCICAKRNLSNPAGLIEFCFCDYNLNANKITLKGFIWHLQYYPTGSNQIIKMHVNIVSDREKEGEGRVEAECRIMKVNLERHVETDACKARWNRESGDSCQLWAQRDEVKLLSAPLSSRLCCRQLVACCEDGQGKGPLYWSLKSLLSRAAWYIITVSTLQKLEDMQCEENSHGSTQFTLM